MNLNLAVNIGSTFACFSGRVASLSPALAEAESDAIRAARRLAALDQVLDVATSSCSYTTVSPKNRLREVRLPLISPLLLSSDVESG